MLAGALLFLGVQDGAAQGDDFAAGGCVEDLDEGYEEGVESGENAEESADFATAPAADCAAEVACRQEEEGDPEQEEDAPDRFVRTEGYDPEQEGEDSPHQECDGYGGGGWSFEPACTDGPSQEGEPPPEEAVGGEGDHAEGIGRPRGMTSRPAVALRISTKAILHA